MVRTLPENPAELKQMILDLVLQLQAKDREVERLAHQLELLKRRHFGTRSEKCIPEQQMLFELLEMVQSAEAKETEEEAAPAEPKEPAKKANGHGRSNPPEHLPKKRIEYPLPEEQCRCRECDSPLEKIGEEVTRQLEYVPASFTVREHVRFKYACKHCQGNVTISEMPPQPIEKGLPGPGLLAHVLTSKYCDHMPLHRQEQMLKRHGIGIARSTLGDWVAACAELVKPLYDRMKEEALQSKVVHTDDTPVPVLDRSRNDTRKGRLWVYRGDGQHPYIVYDYTPNRTRAGPKAFLKRFTGYLQADAYAGYDAIYAVGDVVEVGCWAHARRKFVEAETSDRERSTVALFFIRQLYDVEKEARARQEQDVQFGSEARQMLRVEKARPILESFKAWLDRESRLVLPKSPMGEAIGYALNQWDALTRYVEEGDLAIDNNAAERALRSVVVGRKNWLFAGSDKGGERAAVIYSLIETCKHHGVEPFAYLRDVLSRIAAHPINRIGELLPPNWEPAPPPDDVGREAAGSPTS